MRDYAGLSRLLDEDLALTETVSSRDVMNPENSITEAVKLSLRHSFYKKLAPNNISKDADEAALKLFIELNQTLPGVDENLLASDEDRMLLDTFANVYRSVLDFEIDGVNFDLAFMRDHIMSGPGASIDGNVDTFYTKLFDSPLSTTSPYLITLFRACISDSDHWATAELLRFAQFGFTEVKGNRLFFVKKNAGISRTCATEPALNMLFQQAARAFIELRLKTHFRIDLSRQPAINRRLAAEGSRNGSFGTSDLRSASDSIVTSLVERYTPNNLLGYLMQFRSPHTTLPNGDVVPLRMISTMGNGFTFPLQTVIFASVVKAVYIEKGLKLFTKEGDFNFSVFGDDIVVRREAFDRVNFLLKVLGFTVNEGKSFNDGPFRESCGFDYFRGYEIRGVYVKNIETPSGVYSLINRLTRWSAKHQVPLVRTIRCLISWVGWKPIPFSENDDGGIKVPEFLAPAAVNRQGWRRYKVFRPKPTNRRIPRTADEASTFGYKGFNPSGWGVCFLGGFARNPDSDLPAPSQPGGFLNPPSAEEIADRFDNIGYRPPQGVPIRYKDTVSFIPFWEHFGPYDERFHSVHLAAWLAAWPELVRKNPAQ